MQTLIAVIKMELDVRSSTINQLASAIKALKDFKVTVVNAFKIAIALHIFRAQTTNASICVKMLLAAP